MKYEDKFETEEIVEIDVKGYPKGVFKYKPKNANDESDWLPQYVQMNQNTGKAETDLKKLNQLKVNQIVEVPFCKELIKKMSSLDKEWQDMNIEEKWQVLGKLKGEELDFIIIAINKIGKREDDIKNE